MSEREQPETREEGGDSQTAGSRENEQFDEAHRETPGEAATPGPGHPAPGEGVGMPDRGAGRAKADTTQPIGTQDQGEPSISSREGEGVEDPDEHE